MGWTELKVKVLHEKCDLEVANQRDLPYTAFVVKYKEDGKVYFDIALANKQADIFDHYWDKYRSDFVTMYQSEGRVNPKLWGASTKSKKRGKGQ